KMPAGTLRLMTSAGSLVGPDHFTGADSLLSGPAGGVVGVAEVARAGGFDKAMGVDMGGTSTDVCRFDGRYDYAYDGEVAGVRVLRPRHRIHTVAAGGGSVCRFDGQRLMVGPQSAGADPGPACYGRGGPLTVTDLNLLAGRLDESRFPFALDRDASTRVLEALLKEVREKSADMTEAGLIEGLLEVADLTMASAIRQLSAARGNDPADHVLVAFGGAAPQHACAMADQLGMQRIVIHPMAGILSAYGMGAADVVRFAEQAVLRRLNDASLRSIEKTFAEMAEDLKSQVLAEGARRVDAPRCLLDLRYEGQHTPLTIERPEDADWFEAFAREYQHLYGHDQPDRPIQIVNVRVEVSGRLDRPKIRPASGTDPTPSNRSQASVLTGGAHVDADRYERATLRIGDRVKGPALICEDLTTTWLAPGWSAQVTDRLDLLLESESRSSAPVTGNTEKDPIRLELFNNHFTQIATRMGSTLQRTALSVNIRERLDFSCAILDSAGDLVVNAPHIPVHLGAIGATVKGLLAHQEDLRDGDVYLSNDPDLGGSHLPDLTVMQPVFSDQSLRFFVAARAHHAEIGGRRPGSAFPLARCLAEEGIVFSNQRIVRDGQFEEAGLRKALSGGPWPSRDPDQNIADLRAAMAALAVGRRQLERLIDRETWTMVAAYMGHIRSAAAAKSREAVQRLSGRKYFFEDALDDGAPLRLVAEVIEGCLHLDFSGTGPANPNALNANRAVVESAVMYVMRCLIDEPIPLNAGVLESVDLFLPECMLNPPSNTDPTHHVAVAGGNVELSQRVVDLMLGAFGLAAASQGTMNNLVFGNERFGYYETLCGGAGATGSADGASAIHTHMTNTRLGDVEVIEQRYPVRIESFTIRRGSGGHGRHRGGDGVVRRMVFLEPLSLSLLTQRRTRCPFGLAGGRDAQAGANLLRRAGSNRWQNLGSLVEKEV
ncbi:MAG: hydantoinase B/oxoprolinase family protein, partial [Phycisphaeraceae bacterium]|nr:hydantoinase B/oxoprolinase family protein [Phycisphaeraceae bacterium]